MVRVGVLSGAGGEFVGVAVAGRRRLGGGGAEHEGRRGGRRGPRQRGQRARVNVLDCFTELHTNIITFNTLYEPSVDQPFYTVALRISAVIASMLVTVTIMHK